MLSEFTQKEVDKTRVDFLYIDYLHGQENGMSTIQTFSKSVNLQEIEPDFDLKKYAASYLNDNVSETETFSKFCREEISEGELKIKVRQKIAAHAYYIGSEGRMGGANTIITNNTTNDKYKDYYPDNMSVVLNDNIPDDTFYILYNGKMDQPGFKCIYHIDNDNKLYLSIVGVGFFSRKTSSKIHNILNKKTSD